MRTALIPGVASAPAATAPLLSSRLPEGSGGQPLPERLRWVLEQLSGYDLRDVRVYRASPLPARVGARAFALGTDIHLSIKAEDALEHEAWHVVQQKQGRVRATRTVSLEDPQLGVTGLNADELLEREAEAMGRMARSLVLSGAHIRERETLRVITPRPPVLQLQTKVGDTAYTTKDSNQFKDELRKQLGLAADQLSELNDIVNDLLTENLTFTGWPAVVKEAHIRNVGYRAEASMRQMMEYNSGKHKAAKEEADKKIYDAWQQYNQERKSKNIVARRFQRGSEFSDYCDRLTRGTEVGITRWGAATFFSKYMYDSTTRPMFKWLMGGPTEPLSMNCWEAVLFALVKTGIVDKTYIAWCNSKGDRGTFPGMENLGAFTVLHQQLIKNMDYFWGNAPAAFGKHVKAKPRDNQKRFKALRTGPKFFVPTNVRIPRGRVLLFNLGEHVAISTGELRQMEPKHQIMRQYFQGSTIGHGMIELDGKYPDDQVTFREGCIEELAECHMSYLDNMVVAPFPVCLEAGQILLNGEPAEDIVRHPAVVEAVQKYLDSHASEIDAEKADIYRRRDEKLATVTEQLLGTDAVPVAEHAPQNSAEEEYLRLQKELINAQMQADRELKECVSAWKEKAKDSDTVVQATVVAKKDIQENGKIVFDYNKNDPYGGAIQF